MVVLPHLIIVNQIVLFCRDLRFKMEMETKKIQMIMDLFTPMVVESIVRKVNRPLRIVLFKIMLPTKVVAVEYFATMLHLFFMGAQFLKIQRMMLEVDCIQGKLLILSFIIVLFLIILQNLEGGVIYATSPHLSWIMFFFKKIWQIIQVVGFLLKIIQISKEITYG